MADQTGEPGGKEEAKIPVFTVLKKGSVLKKIFLNSPPPVLDLETGSAERSPKEASQEEEKVLIGRHPDCHIVLDHPSISRFHLEIRVRPSSQKLSVVDLSSVHGTWVSGKKIEPRVPVDVSEGDTVRLGASTRVYELHWVPLSSTFEWDKPLPALQEEQEQTHQAENSIIPAIDHFSFESWASQIPSAPPMPQSMNYPLPSPVPSVQENQIPGIGTLEEMVVSGVPALEILSSTSLTEGKVNRTPETETSPKSPAPMKSEKPVTSSLLSRRGKSISFLRIHPGRSKPKVGTPAFDVGKQEENGVIFEQVTREEILCKFLFSALDGEEGVDEEAFLSDKENMTPEAYYSRKLKKNQMGLQRSSLNNGAALDEKEDMFLSDKENCTPQVPQAFRQVCKGVENSIKSGRLGKELYVSDKENMTPEVSRSHVLKKERMGLQRSDLNIDAAVYEKEYGFFSDKENCTPQVPQDIRQVCKGAENSIKSGKDGEEIYVSDKENMTPEVSRSHILKKDPMGFQRSAMNSDGAWDKKEDGFFSDKENCTPQVPRASRQVCKGDENSINSGRQGEETYVSDKENQRPPVSGDQAATKGDLFIHGRRLEGEIAKKRADRIPFQSLFENSPIKNSPCVGRIPFQSLSEKSASKNSDSAANHSPGNSNLVSQSQKVVHKGSNISVSAEQVHHKAEATRRWNIVADTSCFLNEESRKALQLLEGLRGTHLVIPRMVVRELDCLRRRESHFRKTPKASSALQWIEECMVKTSWWIHVQSSAESMPVAPTPPASPQEQLHEDSNEFHGFISSFMPFSTCGSLAEILSPTAEDHILDCALLLKKIKNDGQLVLLTNEVSLKIKAMAEGLLCESPKEFRESLVNPFSERFLWSESCPRGPTWSCMDEVVQVGNHYNYCPIMRKTTKAADGAKGLKLILLHNSHYAQANLIK